MDQAWSGGAQPRQGYQGAAEKASHRQRLVEYIRTKFNEKLVKHAIDGPAGGKNQGTSRCRQSYAGAPGARFPLPMKNFIGCDLHYADE